MGGQSKSVNSGFFYCSKCDMRVISSHMRNVRGSFGHLWTLCPQVRKEEETMDIEHLKHFATYYPIYKYVASGTKTQAQIREHLESDLVIARSTVHNQMKMLSEGKNIGFLSINGNDDAIQKEEGMVSVNREEALRLVGEIRE